MATGDLKGCLRKLEASLRSLKYPRDVDYQRLAVGDPSACLPIVSFAFTSFSPSLAEHLVDFGVELTGMNDLRFTENVYKVLRDVFSYKPRLTKQQFLQFGFAERKVSILCDVIALVLNKHKELTKESKHVGKPKRRPPIKSCVKNEILSSGSDLLGLTGLTVPQKQPLVERHLGSFPATTQIRYTSDEQHEEETEKQELEDLSQPSEFIVPQKQPLVERHLGSISSTTLIRRTLDAQHDEETEKQELDREHFVDLSQPTESIECVLESRLKGVEAGLLETVGRLEQRLALMELRIHALEKSLAGKIIIEGNQWENLESRVLLLETRLALNSAWVLTPGDGVFNTDKCESKGDTVSASGFSAVIQQPFDEDNGHTVDNSSPTAPQNFKERLDRIVYMMKDTSNILQSIEPTM